VDERRERERATIVLMPNSSVCFNFMHDSQRLRRSAWLVPHVVRHKEDSELVSWRCNWGNTCQSDCFYAMARERERERPPATVQPLN
jgi:hypothetical protein